MFFLRKKDNEIIVKETLNSREINILNETSRDRRYSFESNHDIEINYRYDYNKDKNIYVLTFSFEKMPNNFLYVNETHDSRYSNNMANIMIIDRKISFLIGNLDDPLLTYKDLNFGDKIKVAMSNLNELKNHIIYPLNVMSHAIKNDINGLIESNVNEITNLKYSIFLVNKNEEPNLFSIILLKSKFSKCKDLLFSNRVKKISLHSNNFRMGFKRGRNTRTIDDISVDEFLDDFRGIEVINNLKTNKAISKFITMDALEEEVGKDFSIIL